MPFAIIVYVTDPRSTEDTNVDPREILQGVQLESRFYQSIGFQVKIIPLPPLDCFLLAGETWQDQHNIAAFLSDESTRAQCLSLFETGRSAFDSARVLSVGPQQAQRHNDRLIFISHGTPTTGIYLKPGFVVSFLMGVAFRLATLNPGSYIHFILMSCSGAPISVRRDRDIRASNIGIIGQYFMYLMNEFNIKLNFQFTGYHGGITSNPPNFHRVSMENPHTPFSGRTQKRRVKIEGEKFSTLPFDSDSEADYITFEHDAMRAAPSAISERLISDDHARAVFLNLFTEITNYASRPPFPITLEIAQRGSNHYISCYVVEKNLSTNAIVKKHAIRSANSPDAIAELEAYISEREIQNWV